MCKHCNRPVKFDKHWKQWIHAENNFITCIQSSNWTPPYDRATPEVIQ